MYFILRNYHIGQLYEMKTLLSLASFNQIHAEQYR